MASVASALPARAVGNAEIAERLGVSEDWIVSRPGVRERRVAGPDERLDRLAADAAKLALERAGVEPEQLDLVLVGTFSADELTPNAAPLVAGLLGAHRAGAIDIGAACTAFLSAVALGAGQIEVGRARQVLVVGADLLSRYTDLDDKRTAALFGDGAGAVVLSAVEPPGRIGPVVQRADAGGAAWIHCGRDDHLLRMEGHETFQNAVARLSEVSRQAVEAAGLELDDIDLFVYHQANARILRAVGARLGLTGERVVDCIAGTGNTSAATLPIALSVAEQDGRLQPGAKVLLAAFGAGFTWAGAVIEWGMPPA
jgi:3-oxoacyl-[acyl-carrier-protein] synthase-3